MKWNKMIGKLLVVTGATLAIIGVVLILFKESSIVTFMSLPLLFIGMVISHNSKKGASTIKNEIKNS